MSLQMAAAEGSSSANNRQTNQSFVEGTQSDDEFELHYGYAGLRLWDTAPKTFRQPYFNGITTRKLLNDRLYTYRILKQRWKLCTVSQR